MPTRLEQLQKLVAVDPNDPFAHYGVGLELLGLERFEEACAAFTAALERDPNYVAAYHLRARTEIKMGARPAAAETLRAGIAAAQRVGDRHAAAEMAELLESLG